MLYYFNKHNKSKGMNSMNISKILKSLAICCCCFVVTENISNARLHEINQKVFQNNVSIVLNDYKYKI